MYKSPWNSNFNLKKITIGHICYSKQNFVLTKTWTILIVFTSIGISKWLVIYYCLGRSKTVVEVSEPAGFVIGKVQILSYFFFYIRLQKSFVLSIGIGESYILALFFCILTAGERQYRLLKIWTHLCSKMLKSNIV